ncbi:MAG: hypothetical protein ACOC59_01615 [Bacteroidota bacterium]
MKYLQDNGGTSAGMNSKLKHLCRYNKTCPDFDARLLAGRDDHQLPLMTMTL